MSEMRALVREILTEELLKLRGSMAAVPEQSTEMVSLRTDDDLFAFVRRILEIGQNPARRRALLEGRHRYRLGAAPAHSIQLPPATPVVSSAPPAPPAHHTFSKRLITERDVGLLPAGTRSVAVAKQSRLTPLAQDELRRLNISIERSAA